MKNDYMSEESFLISDFYKRLHKNQQELTLFLFDQIKEKGLEFKIHTGEAYDRFVLWADEALERNSNRDFLTIFTRRNGLLLWPKFYGVGWKSDKAIKLQTDVVHQSQINKGIVELTCKAYESICKKDKTFSNIEENKI